MAARHLVGRAELLRAMLAQPSQPSLADEADSAAPRLASLLGFHARPRSDRVQQGGSLGTNSGQPDISDDESSKPFKVTKVAKPVKKTSLPPLEARFYVVLGAERLTEAEPSDKAAPSLPALGPEDCGPRTLGVAPFVPLVTRTHLWPALKRSLAHLTLGQVDVPGLVRCLARGQSLRRLPRRRHHGLGDEILVILDRASHLIPYDGDYSLLLDEARRLLGPAKVRLLSVLASPNAPLMMQHGQSKPQRARDRMPLPAPGVAVLMLSDLGLLNQSRQTAPVWVDFCRRLSAAGARPVAWLPCSSALVPAGLRDVAQVHGLMRDLRPLGRGGSSNPFNPEAALNALLTRMACCVRVEPALLRALRLLGDDTLQEPGLEALAWGNADKVLTGERFCEIAPDWLSHYRGRFAALAPDDQLAILRTLLALHAYRGRATESAEALIWQAHAVAQTLPEELATAVAEADRWFEQLAISTDTALGDVAVYARDLLARQGRDAAWWRAHSQRLAPLWALSGATDIPDGLDPAAAANSKRAPDQATERYALVQRGGELWLARALSKVVAGEADLDQASVTDRNALAHALAPGMARFGPPSAWPAIPVQGGVAWCRAEGSNGRWLMPQDGRLELPVAADGRGQAYDLISVGLRCRIASLNRPSWALEWGRDSEGLYALALSPLGQAVRLYWRVPIGPLSEKRPLPLCAFQAREVSLAPGLRLGADLEFGLYLDLEVAGVVQRLRWIAPGEFWMGSPAGEPERLHWEGPRHRVRISQGFWLADTACSQALWQAVMGSNPSRFNDDPQNPVEQVSWDDVQDFLGKLQSELSGVELALPTEAEWEYACRAGTETAFHWGNAIRPDQANYDGNYSYNGGPTGEYRQRTLPVKSFKPNAWGLFQMHGNVWEWCADCQRTYGRGAETDPRGPEGERAHRVVRGGAWDYEPRWLRAAYRDQWLRDFRGDDLGFRFSLRSTSQDLAAEQPNQAVPEGPTAKALAPGRRQSKNSERKK